MRKTSNELFLLARETGQSARYSNNETKGQAEEASNFVLIPPAYSVSLPLSRKHYAVVYAPLSFFLWQFSEKENTPQAVNYVLLLTR